jgi:hypothetical protein
MLLYPRYAPPPPEADSRMGKALTNDVEDELQKLLVVDKLRRKEGWYETRESRFGSYAVFLLQPLHLSRLASATRPRCVHGCDHTAACWLNETLLSS